MPRARSRGRNQIRGKPTQTDSHSANQTLDSGGFREGHRAHSEKQLPRLPQPDHREGQAHPRNTGGHAQRRRFRSSRGAETQRREPAHQSRVASDRRHRHAPAGQQGAGFEFNTGRVGPHQALDRPGSKKFGPRHQTHRMAALAGWIEPDLRRGPDIRRPIRRLRPGQSDFRLPPPLGATGDPPDGSPNAEERKQTRRLASRPGACPGLQPGRHHACLRRFPRSEVVAAARKRAAHQTVHGRKKSRGNVGGQPGRPLVRHRRR